MALITSQLLELARDGKSVAEIMSAGPDRPRPAPTSWTASPR